MDAVEGELDLPDPADTAADWRDQLRHLAYGYRKLFYDHPWVSRMMGSYLNVGPRAMDFSNATQRIMHRTGLPGHQLTGAIFALFQFVYGFSTIEANWNSRCREAGLSTEEYFSAVYSKIRSRPGYEESLRLMEHHSGGTVDEKRERDFTVALDCIIAGIEALQDTAESPPPS